tara:strand:+ start:2603 stop:3916 length:1314 start_codon:yes stop_codon:yes gene_type:complete
MAFYTSGLKQILTDPVIDIENNRIEFRLTPNTLFLSDLTLLNFGAHKTGENDMHLNSRAGGWAFIKNISLEDQGTTLDQLLDANVYMAWKGYNTTNSNGMNMDKFKRANDVGKIVNENQQLANAILPKPSRSGYNAQCNLRLSDALPFLRGSQYLPTSIFSDLKVVIELTTAGLSVFSNNTVGSVKIAANPLLRVNEIVNEEAVAQITAAYNGVAFECYERDIAYAATSKADITTKQVTNKHSLLIKGFDNKFINNILIAPIPTDPNAVRMTGAAGELSVGGNLVPIRQINATTQVIVNGANKLIGNGVQRSNEVLGLLVDTYGECATELGSTTTGLYTQINQLYLAQEDADDLESQTGSQGIFATAGYIGLPIMDRISSLVLSYEYTSQFNQMAAAAATAKVSLNKFNTDLNMYVWAGIRKSVVMLGGGGYRVAYN